MKVLGVIDIGSNSIRLVIVRISSQNSYKIVDDIKQSVRLGKDILPNGNLHPIRMQKAISTIRFYKNLSDAFQTDETIVVATEAVRQAANQSEFLAMVKQETGLPVRVLSGEEEAYYDYFSAVNALDLPECLIMDIGGSSTELIWMKDREIHNLASLPFGALSLSEQLATIPGTPAEREKTVNRLLFEYLNNLPWLPKIQTLIGIGGSFRNIAKIDKKLTAYPLEVSHNYQLSWERVLEIHQFVRNTPPDARKEIKGLSSDRADIFLGATTAISAVIEFCNITDIYISGYGLREGLIFEQILPDHRPVANVLDFSLQNLIANYDVNEKHALHVWHLSRSLFEQLKPVHEIEILPDKVLKTAALLHDCGINISYYDHHLHSLYIILNSQINGITHKELIMAAYIAAHHRKNNIKISEAHKDLLQYQEIQIIRKLGIILKISEALDRRMNANVENLYCEIQTDSVTIKLESPSDHELEVREALESSALFLKILGKKLHVL